VRRRKGEKVKRGRGEGEEEKGKRLKGEGAKREKQRIAFPPFRPFPF
jgi:hypothetical protein